MKKTVFLLLTLAAATVFLWPELDFQDQLAQGDHGRDLYAFEAVFKGQRPYKDFWWVYGPLMPYYYGVFYKIFGVHISSILIGRALLVAVCAAFFYLACCTVMPPGLACLAAVWFLEGRQEFICTYTHAGGTLASVVLAFCLLSYIQGGRIRFLWMAWAAAALLMFIKINFGLVSVAVMLAYTPLIDRLMLYPWDKQKRTFYLSLPLLAAGSAFIYWLLLKDLPIYAVRQCMPYWSDDQPYHAPPMEAIRAYLHGFWYILRSTPVNTAVGALFFLSGCVSVVLLAAGKLAKVEAENLGLALGLAVLLFVVYFHEYLLSNVFYRSFWSYPFLALFQFLMVAGAFKILHPVLRLLTVSFLWTCVATAGLAHFHHIQNLKTPEHYLSMPRGRVYVGNESAWVDTVNKATAYLDSRLSKDESFFALPYDCLYYYLTARTSPTRQLIFFDHIKIPRQQEESVVSDLENKHVPYVLMSTRIVSLEEGLGIFGKTYCPLLAQYLQENFVQVYQQGGDPQRPPGWADNHGVFVLERKSY